MSDVLVLCYHAVSERWSAALSVTPAALRTQLELLVRRGYRGTTFSDALAARSGSEKVIAVTFDDGFRSVVQLARPILAELGLPGTVFVPTDYIGSEQPMSWPGIDNWAGTEHEAELVPMSWDEARGLVASGWEIGSHTRTHPYLTRVDAETLTRELLDSRERCTAELGLPCRSLAYPYGDHDDRVVAAARSTGYEFACTLPSRWTTPQPLAYPRVGVWHTDSELVVRTKVSPAVRRVRGSRAWEWLARARSAARR
jgi:peptidoglycan/xylan/chitin deacetylase (PgdA/CDA1 family)